MNFKRMRSGSKWFKVVQFAICDWKMSVQALFQGLLETLPVELPRPEHFWGHEEHGAESVSSSF